MRSKQTETEGLDFAVIGEDAAELARILTAISEDAGDDLRVLEAVGHAAAGMLVNDPAGPQRIAEAIQEALTGS